MLVGSIGSTRIHRCGMKLAEVTTAAVDSAVRADAEATTNEGAPPAHGTRAMLRDEASVKRRRHIPREVRRQVFERDGERCSYVDAEGNRCPASGFLELDHVHPKALGGTDDAANLRVRCRAHNRHYAEQVFGRQHVAARIHLRQRKYRSAPAASFDTTVPSSIVTDFVVAAQHRSGA